MINEDRLKLDNYFFRIKGGETFWRSFDALRKYAEEFELEANQVLQSTKLRKYPATVAQFLDIIQPGFKEKNDSIKVLTSWVMIQQSFYRTSF